MSLSAPGTFQDLRAFIFSDHALELNQELVFRAVALWRLHELGLDSMAGELFNMMTGIALLLALIRRTFAARSLMPVIATSGSLKPHDLRRPTLLPVIGRLISSRSWATLSCGQEKE